MKNDKSQPEVVSEGALVPVVNDLAKPENDTKFAHESAKLLVDIVKQNGWSRKIGGQSDHLQYEAWQTVGKYYGYTVKTGNAEYVELGGNKGFRAKARVVNEITGIEVGGAEAYCMNDEYNWKTKPLFQLASMAQTRAGSKALRQILGFVVALAGYNPTPSEEMDGVVPTVIAEKPQIVKQESTQNQSLISEKQLAFISDLCEQKGVSKDSLEESVWAKAGKQLPEISHEDASQLIKWLLAKPVKAVKKKAITAQPTKVEEDNIDVDEIDKAIDPSNQYAHVN